VVQEWTLANGIPTCSLVSGECRKGEVCVIVGTVQLSNGPPLRPVYFTPLVGQHDLWEARTHSIASTTLSRQLWRSSSSVLEEWLGKIFINSSMDFCFEDEKSLCGSSLLMFPREPLISLSPSWTCSWHWSCFGSCWGSRGGTGLFLGDGGDWWHVSSSSSLLGCSCLTWTSGDNDFLFGDGDLTVSSILGLHRLLVSRLSENSKMMQA